MKIDSNKRNLLVTLAIGGAVVLYTFLIFLPTQRSIAALQDELSVHQNYIAGQQAASIGVSDLEEKLHGTREFAQRWQDSAPDANRLAPVISKLSDCATRSGVTTLQLDPQPAESMALLARAPVTMICEGEFAQVFDFLRRIEQLPNTIWIDKLQLSNSAATHQQVRCELSLVVFTDKRESSD